MIIGLLAACGGASTPSGGAAGDIKVGAIFDLTGATSDVGVPYANGVKAYVDWINGKGGINGRKIDLISQDYAYKVENAERLYSQYVSQDKVVAIIGWGTGDTEALRPKIATDKLPFMSASLSEKLTEVGEAPYNFVVGVNYSDQMRIALQYILQQKANAPGIKVAFLYNDSPFGKSPEPALDEIASKSGMEVLKVAMPRGATDLTAQIQQVQAFAPDYVVVQNTAGPASLALKNAQTVGLQTQFVMLNFAANEILINTAGPAAEGAIGIIPYAPPSADVAAVKDINEYLASKGQGSISDKDKGLVFSQGWATMAVMTEGIKQAAAKGDVTGESIRTALESLQNFETGGIIAPISFGAADHQGAVATKIYQVKNGAWVPISDMMEVKK
jgi:branched-chain amino acid transport system substrate-binding protein